MKKFLSILLAAIMLFAMTASVLAEGGDKSQGDRQVVPHSSVPGISRGEVDNRLLAGNPVPACLHSRDGSQKRFLYRRVRETHHMDADSLGYPAFHGHIRGAHADGS